MQERNHNDNGGGQPALDVGGDQFDDVDLGNGDQPTATSENLATRGAKAIMAAWLLFKSMLVALFSIISGLVSQVWSAIRELFSVFTLVVLAAVFSIVFGPELNAAHPLLYMSEENLNYICAW